MADIIKLDKSAGSDFKKKLQQMQSGISETNEQLRGAESSAKGLQYANISPSIAQTRGRMEDTSKRLREFERTYDEYVREIEQFDSKAARLLQNIPEITEWAQHSGWTADPAIVAINLMEKLVRDGIVIDMAGARAFLLDYQAKLAGLVQTCAYCGDPVNMVTGNFIYSKEDITIPGAFPLVFKRFYNSIGGNSSVMGLNWTHSFNISLEDKGGSVKIAFDDGHMESYEKSEDGSYLPPSGKFNTLVKTEAGFILTNAENLTYHFDHEGRLLWTTDLNGNKTTFSYEGGLLAEVSNQSGKLVFAYSTERLLSEVRDHTGRQVSFAYEDGCLVEVKQPSGAVYQYQYDANNNLSKIINPTGVAIITNEYDESGRNVQQYFADGGCFSFLYEDETLATIATEQNGNQIKYVRDANYRMVKIDYEDSNECFEYNDDDQRTLHQDRNGNIRRYEYDKRGNLVKATNPLKETLQTAYNDFNKPVRIKLCGEVKLQTKYDGHGNATEISDALDRVSKIEYNANGRPIKIIRPDSSEINIEYDARGNILTVGEPSSTTAYEYDELNRVVTSIDGNDNKITYEYNTKGDITKVIDALGHERKYEYNASGKVTRIEDFDGGVIIREYNNMGKPSILVDQEGNETKLQYDLMWNVSSATDANGNTLRYVYDKQNHLAKVTNALGHNIQYAYDPNGNRTTITSPRGEQLHLSYDALDRVIEVIEADGAKTGVDYDHMGQVTKITDALGQERTIIYDKAGQKISETDPSGRELRYSYNLLGQISEVIDVAGRKTIYEYLPGGLLEKIVYPDGRSAKYTYDKNRNIISQISQDGYELYNEYDSLNRITRTYSNKGQEKLYSYDAVGNVTAVTDANDYTTKYVYSPNGNLLAVIDPLGQKTEYGYDRLGNLIEVRQLAELIKARKINEQNSDLRVTKYIRDELGRVERVIDALDNTEIYTYDEAGNVVGKLDKDGYLTKYAYNFTNQLQEVVYADSKSVKFSYNPLRQLTEIKDWLGITSIEVDELGRAKRVMDYNGKEVEYSFGAADERTGVKYPDGKVVTYEYDEALRLKALIDDDNRVEYVYDRNSRLSSKTFSNGASTKYVYNDIGLLSDLIHSDKEGVLDKYAYTYDNMINKTGIEKYRRGMAEESGKYQYTYDALSRLTGVTKDDKLIKSFGYDEFGNRSFMLDKGVRTDYTYNSLNQLLHIEKADHNQDFNYDARGNLTRILENNKVKNSYEFSPLNRLTKAVNAAGQVADYRYNGLGHRVGKQVSDNFNPMKSISYVIDLTKQYHNLLQRTEDGQAKNYAWDFNVVSESGDDDNRFYLQDELGSPLRFIGEDGSLVDSYAFDEFGNDFIGNQGIVQPFGYTGYRFDNVAQTYFAQAREYKPRLGRFISVDFMHDGVNYYTHCYYNPLRFVDRNGLWGEDVHLSDTIKWATDIGIPNSIAASIGYFDNNTDSTFNGTAPWPVIGDQSYHFNRSILPFLTDTRQDHADQNLLLAIFIWNEAQKNYDYEMKRLENAWLFPEQQRNAAKNDLEYYQRMALKLLGEGLHALQDIDAHGQIDAGAFGALGHAFYGKTPDDPDYDWADPETKTILVKSDERLRITETERKTKEYLKIFKSATGIGCVD